MAEVKSWASILDENARNQAEMLSRSPAVVGLLSYISIHIWASLRKVTNWPAHRRLSTQLELWRMLGRQPPCGGLVSQPRSLNERSKSPPYYHS